MPGFWPTTFPAQRLGVNHLIDALWKTFSLKMGLSKKSFDPLFQFPIQRFSKFQRQGLAGFCGLP